MATPKMQRPYAGAMIGTRKSPITMARSMAPIYWIARIIWYRLYRLSHARISQLR